MRFTRRGFIRGASATALALGLGGATLGQSSAKTLGTGSASDEGLEPWSFGVMGDTQWTCPDGKSRVEQLICAS